MDASINDMWRVTAVNLPEHRGNAIHTDEGARAAGFDGALVAGTTVYAYLTHPVARAWGRPWVDHGGCEVRFFHPVLANETLDCVPVRTSSAHSATIEGRVGDSVRACLEVWRHAAPHDRRPGDPIEPLTFELDDELLGYGRRAGDDLALYGSGRVVHPVLWPVLANRTTMATLVDGPWIHVRSRIAHLGPVPVRCNVRIEGAIVDRFDSRAGERAVLQLVASVDRRTVAHIEHESVIRLAS